MRTPIPRRGAARLLAVAGAISLLAVACGGGSKTFSGQGVTFEYPDGWVPVASLSVGTATAAGSTRDAVGLDRNNAAILVISAVRVSVTPQNLASVRSTLAAALAQGAQASGGKAGTPNDDSMSELPGFGMRIDDIQANGVTVSSRFVVAFQGTTEYLMNCQWTSDHADEIQQGCQQIIDTFDVTGPAASTSR